MKYMRKITILDFKGSYYEVGLAHERRLNNSNHYPSCVVKFLWTLNHYYIRGAFLQTESYPIIYESQKSK